MPFRIEENHRLNHQIFRLINHDSGDFVEIIPDLGGTVTQIGITHGGNTVKILREDSDRELNFNPLFRGRILYPFNDRIQDAQYTFEGQTYDLIANSSDGSAIHGYLYNRKMEVSSKSSDTESSRLELNKSFGENELPGYPFPTEIKIAYTLSKNSFKLEFEISNLGKKKIPFGLGWHPYFKLNSPLSDCKLTIPSTEYAEINDMLIPTGKLNSVKDSFYDFFTGENISNQEIDVAYVINSQGETVLENEEMKLTLLQDHKGFPYLQVYIPEERDSIAIEPVTGPANVFNCPELGLPIIDPGKSVISWAEVKFQSKEN